METGQKLLFLEAFFLLLASRIIVLTIPFRLYSGILGKSMLEISAFNDKETTTAQNISRAVKKASNYSPLDSKCLTQAIAAKIMLRRRKIPSTVYLGLAKDENDTLKAHAWVKAGNEFITGRNLHKKFQVISYFGS